MATLFDDHQSHPAMTLQLKVPFKEFAYVTARTPAEIKQMRPSGVCEKGRSKEKQSDAYQQVQKLKKQPMRREGGMIILTERYAPKSGFPGRLWSAGSQGMWGPLRSLVFKDMTELDQTRSVHRIANYVANTFGVSTSVVPYFLEHHEECIRKTMGEQGCGKKKAKLLFNLAWTTQTPLKGINDAFLKTFDKEAKAIRTKLMQIGALDWIAQAADYDPGSFMTKLTHFVETKLSASVLHAMQDHGVHVHAWVHDGLYIDRDHHQSVELQELAHAACEAVAPGINMTWGWKLPDPTVYDMDGRAVHTLSVPDDFVPSASRENEWDPETRPTYDDFQDPREGKEDMVYTGLYTRFSQTHCKVGASFVASDKQPGIYTYPDEAKLIKEYKHLVTFAPPEIATDADGQEYLQEGEKEPNFIVSWLKDYRMDPLYLKDKTEGNYWKYFDCVPNIKECPDDCFNTWRGLAAEDMPAIDWDTEDCTTARECLAKFLGHIKMLCIGNTVEYNFLLDLLAQSVQYPQNKLGIMICLVGPKGCGKTILWTLIQAMIGHGACFETEKPDLDIWGDNNSCIMGKYFLRIMEATKKGFKDHIEAARAKITDEVMRVRALYGAADNIKSFHRFYLDTNNEDCIPDEHDERRFFIIKCSDEKIGQHEYFADLADAIKSPAGVRAFYEFLMARPCKPHYMGKDIPVGDFARKLKDHNRSHGDLFVQAIVEDQRIVQAKITWSVDEVYKFYTEWQAHGNEYSRTKCAVMKLLDLGSIAGITTARPIDPVTNKQYRAYTFDLACLRKRYGIDRAIADEKKAQAVRAGGSSTLIDMVAGEAPAAPLPEIDVDADIAHFLEPPSKRQRL